jgi:DNA-binding response OmpR family regulator
MGSKGVVLLVEDNKELNAINCRALRLRNYTVYTAETIAQAEEQLIMREPDIILLDVMLPDGDGLNFCKRIREMTSAHILFLTAKTDHEDMVRGLLSGGDDYIAKPYHPEELLARVDAAMRRRNMTPASAGVVTKGALALNIAAGMAFVNGIALPLTPKEFSLLLLLSQNEDKVISAKELYEKAWNAPLAGDKNALQTAVSKLRSKLEPTGYTVAARRGQGYVFEKN